MLQKLVVALNALSSPILAILVILIGCAYSVISKQYGIEANTAAGIVGAGIGLLTGQVLATTRSQLSDPEPGRSSASSQTSQVTEKPASAFPQS
jgi:membrane associated rhomboid family serine protease